MPAGRAGHWAVSKHEHIRSGDRKKITHWYWVSISCHQQKVIKLLWSTYRWAGSLLNILVDDFLATFTRGSAVDAISLQLASDCSINDDIVISLLYIRTTCNIQPANQMWESWHTPQCTSEWSRQLWPIKILKIRNVMQDKNWEDILQMFFPLVFIHLAYAYIPRKTMIF